MKYSIKSFKVLMYGQIDGPILMYNVTTHTNSRNVRHSAVSNVLVKLEVNNYTLIGDVPVGTKDCFPDFVDGAFNSTVACRMDSLLRRALHILNRNTIHQT